MGNPASEEDSWRGTARRQPRTDSYVIDRHQDHYGAAQKIDGRNTRLRRCSELQRSGRQGSTHGSAPGRGCSGTPPILVQHLGTHTIFDAFRRKLYRRWEWPCWFPWIDRKTPPNLLPAHARINLINAS